jgi:hypothetical protein
MKSNLLAFGVLAVLMVIFLMFTNQEYNRRLELVNPPTPTLAPHERYVRYEVHGAGNAHMRVINHDGVAEQYYDHLPYSMEVTAPTGRIVSLAAKDDGYGEITCQIYVDGAKVKEATATGEYSTATCSSTVP